MEHESIGAARMARGTGLAMVLVLSAGAGGASAEMAYCYQFRSITNNSAVDSATGQHQLRMFVSPAGQTPTGSNLVDFRFENIGPDPCAITDIYFYDGWLLGIWQIDSSAGVTFDDNAKPEWLAGYRGGDPSQVFSNLFSADSNSAVQLNGVNPGEWLNIRFELKGPATIANVISDLAKPPRDFYRLVVGLHVQGFADGGSESFVHDQAGAVVVPVPPAIWGGVGLMGVLGLGQGIRWLRGREI
jgi:hypothetical protein